MKSISELRSEIWGDELPSLDSFRKKDGSFDFDAATAFLNDPETKKLIRFLMTSEDGAKE